MENVAFLFAILVCLVLVVATLILIVGSFLGGIERIFFNGSYPQWRMQRKAKKLAVEVGDNDLVTNQFLANHFAYYRMLDVMEQKEFLIRVHFFKNTLQYGSAEGFVLDEIVKIKIASAFAQITFGFDDYALRTVNNVVIYPDTFYSRLLNNYVKGLTVFNGNVFLSWAAFEEGYKIANDKINLALHELAHLLQVEYEDRTGSTSWDLNEWSIVAEDYIELHQFDNSTGFFREYGLRNIYEFWAVNVECFFEKPDEYARLYPELYRATADTLQQDMLPRLMRGATAIKSSTSIDAVLGTEKEV